MGVFPFPGVSFIHVLVVQGLCPCSLSLPAVAERSLAPWSMLACKSGMQILSVLSLCSSGAIL